MLGFFVERKPRPTSFHNIRKLYRNHFGNCKGLHSVNLPQRFSTRRVKFVILQATGWSKEDKNLSPSDLWTRGQGYVSSPGQLVLVILQRSFEPNSRMFFNFDLDEGQNFFSTQVNSMAPVPLQLAASRNGITRR